MMVSELIEQLKNYPSDMRVLTLGYEGGYNDIDLNTADIVFNVNDKDTWYYGPHEYVSFMDGLTNSESQWRKPGVESGKCVIIGRSKFVFPYKIQ
jgi:hypothetical protein